MSIDSIYVNLDRRAEKYRVGFALNIRIDGDQKQKILSNYVNKLYYYVLNPLSQIDIGDLSKRLSSHTVSSNVCPTFQNALPNN